MHQKAGKQELAERLRSQEVNRAFKREMKQQSGWGASKWGLHHPLPSLRVTLLPEPQCPPPHNSPPNLIQDAVLGSGDGGVEGIDPRFLLFRTHCQEDQVRCL